MPISGISNDARDIRTRASEGDERCLLAFDMFAYKAMQQAGSMIASMAGVDTITFTAGIGENDWSIRKAFCDCFEWLGVRIDNNKNREARGQRPAGHQCCRLRRHGHGHPHRRGIHDRPRRRASDR